MIGGQWQRPTGRMAMSAMSSVHSLLRAASFISRNQRRIEQPIGLVKVERLWKPSGSASSLSRKSGLNLQYQIILYHMHQNGWKEKDWWYQWECGTAEMLMHCWWECKLVDSCWKTVFSIYEGWIYVIADSLAFPFLGMCPAKTYTFEDQKTCIRMLIIALSVMVRNKQKTLIYGLLIK